MSLNSKELAIKERTEKAAAWRSDDFGHDTHALLVAESEALQIAADDIVYLLETVSKLRGALISIAAFHLTEDQIKACGGDEVLTDTQIAREALEETK